MKKVLWTDNRIFKTRDESLPENGWVEFGRVEESGGERSLRKTLCHHGDTRSNHGEL